MPALETASAAALLKLSAASSDTVASSFIGPYHGLGFGHPIHHHGHPVGPQEPSWAEKVWAEMRKPPAPVRHFPSGVDIHHTGPIPVHHTEPSPPPPAAPSTPEHLVHHVGPVSAPADHVAPPRTPVLEGHHPDGPAPAPSTSYQQPPVNPAAGVEDGPHPPPTPAVRGLPPPEAPVSDRGPGPIAPPHDIPSLAPPSMPHTTLPPGPAPAVAEPIMAPPVQHTVDAEPGAHPIPIEHMAPDKPELPAGAPETGPMPQPQTAMPPPPHQPGVGMSDGPEPAPSIRTWTVLPLRPPVPSGFDVNMLFPMAAFEELASDFVSMATQAMVVAEAGAAGIAASTAPFARACIGSRDERRRPA